MPQATAQRSTVILLAALVILTTLPLVFSALGRAESWSYVITAPSDESLAPEMNRLGGLGYELVAARRATNSTGNGTARYELIFRKRGKPIPYVTHEQRASHEVEMYLEKNGLGHPTK